MRFNIEDRSGYLYTVEVTGRSFRFIELLPSDENPYILEELVLTPQEYLKEFELDKEELEEFNELLKNISMKIARMRNA